MKWKHIKSTCLCEFEISETAKNEAYATRTPTQSTCLVEDCRSSRLVPTLGDSATESDSRQLLVDGGREDLLDRLQRPQIRLRHPKPQHHHCGCSQSCEEEVRPGGEASEEDGRYERGEEIRVLLPFISEMLRSSSIGACLQS